MRQNAAIWSPGVNADEAYVAFTEAATIALADRRDVAPGRAHPATILEAHLGGLTAWAHALSSSYQVVEAHMTPEVSIDGRLQTPVAPRAPDDGRIRILIGRTLWVTGDEDDRSLTADPRDLWLPYEMQRQRYGRRLVEALAWLWRQLGVERARATAVTAESRAAFAAWGWTAQPPDVNDDHIEYWLQLNGQQGKAT